MPKRKRPTSDADPGRARRTKKQDVIDKITQSKKLLHRALKTAKGFERQKLGKRQKAAIDNNKFEDVRRINGEIEALKGLDLDRTTDAHLQKSLLKVKAIAESEFLPEDVKREIEKPRLGEAERKALQNVMSGMFNTKPVKDTVAQIINGMYIVLGIPQPLPGQGKKSKEPSKGILMVNYKDTDVSEDGVLPGKEDNNLELSWDGFESEVETTKGYSKPEDSDEEENASDDDVEIDEEILSKYDALLGGSSDEESFDEELYKSKRGPQSTTRQSLSLSPEPSDASVSNPSIQSPSQSPSPSPPPEKATKKAKVASSVEPIKASTFLPSLMGGYWSGSESSASDIEESNSAPLKKNRKGQMARRAIWEKKFKDNANHIVSGAGPVSQGKDDGWDAKRGAKDGGPRRRGGRGGRGGSGDRGGRQSGFSRSTGENSTPVGDRKGGKVSDKRDDTGPLHPSWQAAKRAKTEQKTATFTGKKVVFD